MFNYIRISELYKLCLKFKTSTNNNLESWALALFCKKINKKS